METKFDEFNLLIKKDDDISGVDNIPDTIKRAVLVARAPEPLRTHFQLTSQSYTTFFRDASGNQSAPESTQRFKLMERDDPMDVDFVHKEGQKGKEKGNDKGKGKPESIGKDSRIKKSSKAHAGIVARQDTSGANVGRKAVERRNKANNVGETEKTGDVNWIMMVEDLSVCNPAQVKLSRGDILGVQFLAKAHTKFSSMQSQIALFPIPMLLSMLQCQVRHSRAQLTTHISLTSDLDLRILCPLEFATQS